jgi:hypothetical protein
MLAMEPIAETARRDEKELDCELARAAPKILAALLDGVAAGLRNLATVKIADKPRMADFALWAEACTCAYWPEGTFLRAYRENIASAVELVLEANAVGNAVRAFMAGRQASWEGTASELLPLLTALIPENAAREREWPKRADALSGKLRRVAPALRRTGLHIAFSRTGQTRTIRMEARAAPEQRGKTASQASRASQQGGNPSKNNGRASDANDAAVTPGDASGVTASPLKRSANDAGDANDAALHRSSGPMSDVEAALAELADRQRP